MKHRSSSHSAIVAQIIAGKVASEEGQVKATVSQASSPGMTTGSSAAGAVLASQANTTVISQPFLAIER